MNELDRAIRDLVIANRILAREDVVDAYGHVSVRHPTKPDHYLLSRSLSPELVTKDDIIEFMLDGTPVTDKRPPYLERFIHGAIYEARPEIRAVVHSHAEDTLPFSISKTTPLCCVAHVASDMGTKVPVWDIADKFGDATNLLVTNMAQGRDMARKLERQIGCSDARPWLLGCRGFAAQGGAAVRLSAAQRTHPAARDAARASSRACRRARSIRGTATGRRSRPCSAVGSTGRSGPAVPTCWVPILAAFERSRNSSSCF